MSPFLGGQLFLLSKDDIHSRLCSPASQHLHVVTQQNIQALRSNLPFYKARDLYISRFLFSLDNIILSS